MYRQRGLGSGEDFAGRTDWKSIKTQARRGVAVPLADARERLAPP